MKKKTTTKTPLIKAKPSKKDRAKLYLLSGKKFTPRQLDRILDCNNSPEYIRQLRAEGMNIDMERIEVKKTGTWYGRYSYIAPKKVSKIQSREYMTNFKHHAL